CKIFISGQKIISSSNDKTVRIWDIKSGQQLHIFKEYFHRFRIAEFSPDKQLIASGSTDKTIKFWDIKSKKEIKILIGHSAGILSVQFSSDNKIIASSSVDKTIYLWNINKIRHLHYVNDIKYFPDGQTIVSCSEYQENKYKN
ncbi:WD-40 repeat protein, partial [Reticulomyxa filosa]